MLRGGSSVMPWEFRLRPFWISPHSTADFTVDSPAALGLAPLLQELRRKLKPVWQLISKVEAGLTGEAASSLKTYASQRQQGGSGTTDALVEILQLHGGSFWTEGPTGGRVRLLTGDCAMDDGVNELPFDALRDSLLKAHGVDFVALDAAASQLLPLALGAQLLSGGRQQISVVDPHMAVRGFQWPPEAAVTAALQLRRKDLEVRVADGRVEVARRSLFRATSSSSSSSSRPATLSAAVAPQTSSWAKFCR
jgi:hypothetical protein